ncbi:MAG TPA: gliding motility-associated C-terminal domain-containing protein [Saprospiraceae bacterium]|nr:gliding motility-associated C-terminal domain-containing protein [Saprospiraceae bacterium]
MNTTSRIGRIFPLFFFALGLLWPAASWATHNRAGEIHIRQIGPRTIEATIITWTKTSSVQADRDTLNICWGDNTPCQPVRRSNGGGNGVELPNNIKYNTYIAIHTYAVPGQYRISMTDPNRNAGIINVNPPASDNVTFHIETYYQFQNAQFGGNNTTPYLLQPPVDNACVGQPFKHNPNASDPEGDSLSYHLIKPLQNSDSPVPNYSFPNEVMPGPGNQLSLDERTGDLVWDAPQRAGEYNVAMIIVSWRNGHAIDTTIRDMQIFVEECENHPPKVEAPKEICVVAGKTVEFSVTATDPDSSDYVQLTALGSPLISAYSPAKFTVPSGYRKPPVVGQFKWVTACEHISGQPYSVVFKAVDSLGSNPRLADLKAVFIKVVGPAPEGVQAEAQLGEVSISWDKPYACEGAAEQYFYGFSVWRRESSNPFVPDTCTPGLAGKGYTEIEFATTAVKDGRYFFQDKNVERGRTYCYRVLAKFARRSTGGYAYNIVESLPSAEVCVQLPRDLPLITNVTVISTGSADGQMEVRWSKPVAQDLDTLINHGPYRYQLLRASGLTGGILQEVPGGSFTAAQFWQANDTVFLDKNLNTAGQPYHYQVAFYAGSNPTPLGKTNEASSVYLRVRATDRRNRLTWEEDVPWANYRYEVYRRDDQSGGQFLLIGSTEGLQYEDRGLINGKNYCYYIRSIGTYSIEGVIDPIYNLSQEACGIPLDTLPPCTPTLTVKNLCDDNGDPTPPYENVLTWNNPNTSCPETDDVLAYHIWYAPAEGEPLARIERIEGADKTAFIHRLEDGLAGCYAISAVDSVGNESPQGTPPICKDNCPRYELPNVFTPNGDGKNDRYTPFPNWRFVERVDMQIFNRWGNLVFQTTDPALNWTGVNLDGKELADGTYLYVCRVYEKRVGGTLLRPDALSGYIELIRGDR